MPVSPKTARDPALDKLRPYEHHGVALVVTGTHAVGDCPFCGRVGKFSVEICTSKGRCWVCGTGSVAGGFNGLEFTRLIHSDAVTGRQGIGNGNRTAFLEAVAADRRLLSPATAAAWGVAQARDGTWLVPGHKYDGELDQVYRRTMMGEKWLLLPTPGIWTEGKAHALHMAADDFDPARPGIDVFEGPWDGMAAWEVREVLGETNIVAVPGCTTWRDEWTEMCRGKNVRLWYDSDHPREVIPGSGRVSRAGYDGMARIARRLSGVAATVKYLRWGAEGFDPNKPNGHDVRDSLSAGATLDDRKLLMVELLTKHEHAPREWFNAQIENGRPHSNDSVEAMPCSTWAECAAAWEDAMRMRQDLRDVVAVVLAVAASTRQGGNQLFLDVIGSPGSGKTTICQGLLVSGNAVHFENATKLVSGWKKPDDKDKDCSFLARANNKLWVTCEFDVMRSSPEYPQLMGKIRRIFDGETSTTYGNDDKDRVYVGLRTPWIRAGTQKMMDAMADHDQSQLGDRFQRIIVTDPDNKERREVSRSAMRSERSAMVDRSNGTSGGLLDPKTRKAHALMGGYVDWLFENAEEQIARVDIPPFAEDHCLDLAELCADMRARPNEDKRRVDSHDVKEMPTRLARQNMRLAGFLAVVLNKFTVDMEVLRIVRKVALDTATGHSLKIAGWLCSPNARTGKMHQEHGLMKGQLSTWTSMVSERLDKYLDFLCKIGVLQLHSHSHMGNSWTLTERVFDLYTKVTK